MSLASFMAALDEADDPGVALVDRIVATAADRELAVLVEACAVPRRVDATIVGVLRGRPEDVVGNARLLRELCEYPFLKPREGGGFRVLYPHPATANLALPRLAAASVSQPRFKDSCGNATA